MTDPAPAPFSPPPDGAGHLLEKTFIGRNGLRAGWRLLVFLTLALLVLLIAETLLGLLYPAAGRSSGALTEMAVLMPEVPMLLSVFAAAFVMGRIERRSFRAYGLPLREAFRARFWEGVVWGFAAISALMAVLAGLHCLSLSRAGLRWGPAAMHGLLWAVTLLSVAFFEEFGFRGYALATLSEGIGYWPAAVLMSVVFGAVHLTNSGETAAGVIEIFLIGLFFCLALRRTGSLWFGVGLHAAWDWGESFFYGVPDSGEVVHHHLLAGTAHGSAWLSGGVTGPEASVLALLLVAILAALASRRFHEVRFPPAS